MTLAGSDAAYWRWQARAASLTRTRRLQVLDRIRAYAAGGLPCQPEWKAIVRLGPAALARRRGSVPWHLGGSNNPGPNGTRPPLQPLPVGSPGK
jgi:hypothetical protein